MKHSITVNGSEFGEAIKTATVYANKDNEPNDGLCHILISLLSKQKKIAIVACDGHGYYERRIGLIPQKGQKPTLPDKEQRLCIFNKDIAMLTNLSVARKGEILL